MSIEFTDRYKAMGISYPEPETVCKGHCEGTGVYPVFNADHRQKTRRAVLLQAETTQEEMRLWWEAHGKSHSLKDHLRIAWKYRDITWMWKEWRCDGWHFIKCADCKGTGKREVPK